MHREVQHNQSDVLVKLIITGVFLMVHSRAAIKGDCNSVIIK